MRCRKHGVDGCKDSVQLVKAGPNRSDMRCLSCGYSMAAHLADIRARARAKRDAARKAERSVWTEPLFD